MLGVTIEAQFENRFAREIMIGVTRDIVFGPVISFGAGGTRVEIFQDRALALPPLNYFIAHQLISKTRILKPGGKLNQLSESQLENIIHTLLCVSEMICELPHIQEMDINPFILNETGMIAVDARMVVAEQANASAPYRHLAIHPYPS
jgi:acetyltransferase